MDKAMPNKFEGRLSTLPAPKHLTASEAALAPMLAMKAVSARMEERRKKASDAYLSALRKIATEEDAAFAEVVELARLADAQRQLVAFSGDAQIHDGDF